MKLDTLSESGGSDHQEPRFPNRPRRQAPGARYENTRSIGRGNARVAALKVTVLRKSGGLALQVFCRTRVYADLRPFSCAVSLGFDWVAHRATWPGPSKIGSTVSSTVKSFRAWCIPSNTHDLGGSVLRCTQTISNGNPHEF